MTSFIKDPDAVLEYAVDWSEWLADSETISTSTWVVPVGINEDSASSGTTAATIWLSGGMDGQQYALTNRITTSQGRTDDRTITLFVRHR